MHKAIVILLEMNFCILSNLYQRSNFSIKDYPYWIIGINWNIYEINDILHLGFHIHGYLVMDMSCSEKQIFFLKQNIRAYFLSKIEITVFSIH